MSQKIQFTDEEVGEYSKRYIAGESTRALAIVKGCSQPTLTSFLRSIGVSIRPDGRRFLNFSIKDRREIVSQYRKGVSTYDLASRYQVSHPTITKILEENGTPRRNASDARRQYPLDQTVFNSINDDSAYWIGFLMADGYVSKELSLFSVSVSQKDAHHLDSLRCFLKTNHPIYVKPGRKKTWGTRRVYRSSPTHVLTIYSSEIAAALNSYGVTPRKSRTAHVVGDALLLNHHFWRGVVDGDGEVSVRKNGTQKNYPIVGLAGAKKLLRQFRSFVKQFIPNHEASVRPHKNHWVLRINGRNAVSLARILYDGCRTALPRKLKKAIRMMRINKKPAVSPGKRLRRVLVLG